MDDDHMNEDGTSGRIREKLIATKQLWAKDGRLLTGRPSHREEDRLPPGQRKTTDWPVLDLGVKPEHSAGKLGACRSTDWVAQPMRLDWKAFQSLPQTDFTSDIHCVTAWSRFDNRWRGVSVRDLLERVQPKAEARFVTLFSYDTYSTNLPIEEFAVEDALLATIGTASRSASTMVVRVRAIVPQLYFWKSAKWVKRIAFTDADQPGFWEERGYHNHGDPCASSATVK